MNLTIHDSARRIADLERDLARIQTEETTPRQIEANLVREKLGATLATAAVLAQTAIDVLDKLGDSFEESVERMSRDLNGKG
jgi:hypothetical protein